MGATFPNGIWPTMITPFTDSNAIDFTSLGKLIDWYLDRGVSGLFAVCQSSEMFYLSLPERIELAHFVKNAAGDRVPVIASGHISDNPADQIREINAMAETGIDACILVTNRLAGANEPDSVWKGNLEELLRHIPDIPLGFYECPYPYKRLLSPELLRWCADVGRFFFLKDTSCDVDSIQMKLDTIEGTGLKIYNANAQTLYPTLKLGVVGYSGIMANFHPELYVRALERFHTDSDSVRELFAFLGLAAMIEYEYYPICAKYFLHLEGIGLALNSRTLDYRRFTQTQKLQVQQLRLLSQRYITACQTGIE